MEMFNKPDDRWMRTEGEMEKCQSCKTGEGTEELHSCPYNSDIYEDDSECCNCCEDCVQECADDI